MNEDIYSSTQFSDKPIRCDIPGCNNLGTEMFDEEVDDLSTFSVYLCGKCKEEW